MQCSATGEEEWSSRRARQSALWDRDFSFTCMGTSKTGGECRPCQLPSRFLQGVDEGRSSICTLCTWCCFALLPGEGLFISCCEAGPRTDEDFVASNNLYITKALLHAGGRALSCSGSLWVFCASCLHVHHTPEDQLCFCWQETAGKRPKSGHFAVRLRGRSAVSMGVRAAHLRNQYKERGRAREAAQGSGPRSSFRSARC